MFAIVVLAVAGYLGYRLSRSSRTDAAPARTGCAHRTCNPRRQGFEHVAGRAVDARRADLGSDLLGNTNRTTLGNGDRASVGPTPR